MGHSGECEKDQHARCGVVSCFNMDLARIFLLWALIALYMLFGAVVFSALERPTELKAYQLWERHLEDFSREHRVHPDVLRVLLKQYEEATAAGVRVERRRPRWNFSGAFYFVATVVSTIGFGMAAPATISGKVFLIFYGLIGCSASILFFNLFLERVITFIASLIRRCHKKRQSGLNGVNNTGDGNGEAEWKPSVYYVTAVLGSMALLVACGASGLYSAMEDWDYLESLYFCFVAFSTMGFGDMVSGQKEHYEAAWVYQIVNSLTILLGVCCTYALFNIISIVIKQMLNWILKKLLYVKCCPGSGQRRRGQGLALSCCSFTCLHDRSPVQQQQQQQRQKIQITASHQGQHWSCHVVMSSLPSTSRPKCRCAIATVETVCGGEVQGAGETASDFECRFSGEMVCESDDSDTLSKAATRESPAAASAAFLHVRHNSLPEGVSAISILNKRLQEARVNI
ncbi:potassium channel subfamily K member 13 [Chanos chanos]|uniref:Potassium channel subfamily K member 13 n=1 Tax=Chanos chanos TaxID=29144 RepID=A0A6J2VLG1_CHACN|nr:potassium channel subfamily K member 13-like [Chanos chanos]